MKKRVKVLQFFEEVEIGLIGKGLHAAGVELDYVKLWTDERQVPVHLNDSQGLIVLGGDWSAYQIREVPALQTAQAFLQAALVLELPTLGICLGAQLLAQTLGAEVHAMKQKEIGWFPVEFSEKVREDELLDFVDREHTLFEWHGDEFEVPAGAVNLAGNERCPHQLFRYGTNAYGLQFHPEVDERVLARWLGSPDFDKTARENGTSREKLLEGCATHLPGQRAWTKEFVRRFARSL